MDVEAIRGMTIEEIIEHLKRISGALREGFDACRRESRAYPDNPVVLVAMEGMQQLYSVVASDIYATFGIDSGVAGRPGDDIAGHRTRGAADAENGTRGAADAGNGTRAGDGRAVRQPPTWVRRAKLVRYWRFAMQVAGTMTRENLESAFAAEYTSRWRAELECERLRDRLRKKGGV